ncbi:T9SS type A sorting domain-containing protein [Nostoc sp. NIES-2111]
MRFLSFALLLLATFLHTQAWAQGEPLSTGRRFTNGLMYPPPVQTHAATLRNKDLLVFSEDNICRVDSTGRILWAKRIRYNPADSLRFAAGDVIELASGKLILSSLTELNRVSTYNPRRKHQIVCLNPTGSLAWVREGSMPVCGDWDHRIAGNIVLSSAGDAVWFALPDSSRSLAQSFRLVRMDTLGNITLARRYALAQAGNLLPVGIIPQQNRLDVIMATGEGWGTGSPNRILAMQTDLNGTILAASQVSDTLLSGSWEPISFAQMSGKAGLLHGAAHDSAMRPKLMYISGDLRDFKIIHLDSLGETPTVPDLPFVMGVAEARGGAMLNTTSGMAYIDTLLHNHRTILQYANFAPGFMLCRGGSKEYTALGGHVVNTDLVDMYIRQYSMYAASLSLSRPLPTVCTFGSRPVKSIYTTPMASGPYSTSNLSQSPAGYPLRTPPCTVTDFPMCSLDNCNWHFSLTDIEIVDSSGRSSRTITIPDLFALFPGGQISLSNGDTGRVVTLPIPGTVSCNVSGPCGNYTFNITLRGLPTEVQRTLPNGVLAAVPNPATESFRLEGLHQATPLRLVDALGRTVLQGSAEPGRSISLKHVVPGVYYWQVGIQSGRLVVE